MDPVSLRDSLIEAMKQVSAKRTDVPPRVGARSPNGLLLAMPGYVPGLGLSAKLVSVFAGNAELGLPSHNGVVVLFDEVTGVPLALMDAEYLTETRTAAVSAIAADLLARADSEVLTIFGAGAQARGHLRCFAGLRPWREIRIVNRSQPNAVVLAALAADLVGCATQVVESVEAALEGADVVVLCTHSETPLFSAGVVPVGAHVSSVSSSYEIDPELARLARPLVVEWREAITTPTPAGAAELQGLDPALAVELGELLQDQSLGRTDDAAVTLYKSTGHAAQDVAAASTVYSAALAAGVGLKIKL